MKTTSMCAAAIAALATASAGAGTTTWTFDVTTEGENVSWTSPTPLDPAAALYVSDYLITLVEVDVLWLGLPFNDVDVTDQVPPELRMGTEALPGPAPVTLFDQLIEFPGPPDPVCLAAQLLISLDASGFGHLDATDVVLGQCDVDIGFGTVTVDLQSVRFVGRITTDALSCPWDLDGDGAVGILDFLDLLAAWGAAVTGPPDVDGDGIVGILDFLGLLSQWGPCPD